MFQLYGAAKCLHCNPQVCRFRKIKMSDSSPAIPGVLSNSVTAFDQGGQQTAYHCTTASDAAWMTRLRWDTTPMNLPLQSGTVDCVLVLQARSKLSKCAGQTLRRTLQNAMASLRYADFLAFPHRRFSDRLTYSWSI